MKLTIITLIIISIMFGCSALQINDSIRQPMTRNAAICAIQTVAVIIGYFAAQKPDVDLVLRSIYQEAVEGKISNDQVNKILERLNRDNQIEQTLYTGILRIAELLGANVLGGKIVDVVGIDPEFMAAIRRGYIEGYDRYTRELSANKE